MASGGGGVEVDGGGGDAAAAQNGLRNGEPGRKRFETIFNRNRPCFPYNDVYTAEAAFDDVGKRLASG